MNITNILLTFQLNLPFCIVPGIKQTLNGFIELMSHSARCTQSDTIKILNTEEGCEYIKHILLSEWKCQD